METKTFFAEKYQQFELLIRIICDIRPGQLHKIDAVYAYGQTVDNQMSSLTSAVNICRKRRIKIGIPAYGNVSGFAGSDIWKKILITAGIKEARIVTVPHAKELPPCTDAEARGLVRLACERGWNKVCIIAPPLHIVRAFVSTVSAAKRYGSDLEIYSLTGEANDWQEKVVHSQGTTTGARKGLLHGEMDRLDKYHSEGILISAEDVLAYLDWRDSKR